MLMMVGTASRGISLFTGVSTIILYFSSYVIARFIVFLLFCSSFHVVITCPALLRFPIPSLPWRSPAERIARNPPP